MDLRPTHNDLHEAKRACLEASLEAGYEGPEAMELKQSNIKKGVRFCLNKARKSRHANISFSSNRMDGGVDQVVASWSPKNAPAALDVTQIVAQTVTKPVKNFGISFEGEKK